MKWLLLVVVGLCALGALAAPLPARADPPPLYTVVPQVTCITLNSDATQATVHWGYTNHAATPITLDIGVYNFMTPGANNQGQPTVFQNGTVTDAFTDTFALASQSSLDWHLDGLSAVATLASPYCVQGSAPVNSSAPAVIGTPQVGQTLTADEGQWLTDCAVTFSNAWQTSHNNQPWQNVGTGATYTPVAGDVGAQLRVEVIAGNCNGTASALDSAAVGPITSLPQPPVNTAAPSIKVVQGGFQPGRTTTVVSSNGGAWTGTPTLTYQWQRCTATQCADIAGATKAKYTVGAADAGDLLRVVVTASTSGGTATAVSAEVDPSTGGDTGVR